MDRSTPPPPNEGTPKDATTRAQDREREPQDPKAVRPKTEPPRTTTGPMTSPKFGSAGSGGAELEPPTRNPDR